MFWEFVSERIESVESLEDVYEKLDELFPFREPRETTLDAVEITPDGRWLVSSGRTGTGFIRLRHLKVDRLIEMARRKAGRELTEEERQQYHLENALE